MSNMNIDWNELDKGISEEMQKQAWNGFVDTKLDTGDGKGFWNNAKKGINFLTAVPSATFNLTSGALQTAYGGARLLADGPGAVSRLINKQIPTLIDNVGKFAPLAMGALAIPALMKRKRQGGSGNSDQPIVVNNYLGRKPTMLDPQSGVNSLSTPKMASLADKQADAVIKILADAAKRRMANKVLDTVATSKPEEEKKSDKELEVVTKYPEVAKLLEDEQNRAYLNRLLDR
jgi:hypothetical protein